MEKNMNRYLSSLVFFYHKLQSYHWYVQGPKFFEAHAKLEEYYDGINEQIDEVAELMLMAGLKPVSTVKEFSEFTQISDAPGTAVKDINKIFDDVLEGFECLDACAKEVKKQAESADNIFISTKMDDFIAGYAKTKWMLKSVLA